VLNIQKTNHGSENKTLSEISLRVLSILSGVEFLLKQTIFLLSNFARWLSVYDTLILIPRVAALTDCHSNKLAEGLSCSGTSLLVNTIDSVGQVTAQTPHPMQLST